MTGIHDRLLPYRTFLKNEKQRLTDSIVLLEQQSRQDEANLQKIRLNILGVFETVASADEKQTTSWAAFCQRYEPRFETLAAPWRARLTMAKQHGDVQTQTVEEAKLSMANDIREVFISIKERTS